MKQFLKRIITFAVFFSFSVAVAATCGCGTSANNRALTATYNTTLDNCVCACDGCINACDGYPFLAYRSQSVNAAREIVGWQEFINKYNMCDLYGSFYVAAEYTRSFRPYQISQFFFGEHLIDCNSLLIQGNSVQNRNPKAWFADQFGLPGDFESRVSFCPLIDNFIIDMGLFVGLDKWRQGLYFKIHAPLVHTRWDLGMCECVSNPGEEGFHSLYMSPHRVEREALPASFTDYMNNNITFGDMKEPLKCGRISVCRLKETRLSDIHFTFGYNWKICEDYHYGINLHLAAPTGNRPKGCFLFEPIIGNGKHWELGLGFSGSWTFWRGCGCEEEFLALYCDATFTHLLKTCQCRSFDFCGRPNSRYMLLAQMGKNVDDINGGSNGTKTANSEYAKTLLPAINYTTMNVDVKIGLQADIALKLAWVRDEWSFDLGYNLWGRTGEKFCNKNCCGCFPCSKGLYAIKGDATLYGYRDRDRSTTPVPMSSSQMYANIHNGINMLLNEDDRQANKGVDNPQPAFAGNDLLGYTIPGTTPIDVHLNTSIQPVLVSRANINLCKSPGALTHKFFWNASHAWKDMDARWLPFLGIGGEIEIAQNGKCCDCGPCNNFCIDPCSNKCNRESDKKKRGAVSQWGLWLKGGLYFE